jgi:hypothetical protein
MRVIGIQINSTQVATVKQANRVVLLESDSPAVEHQGDIVSARGTSKNSNSRNQRSVPFSSHFLSVEQFLKLIMAELPELLKRRAILNSPVNINIRPCKRSCSSDFLICSLDLSQE